jgi:prepilin-type N-terminal cleavage/methylation domain-containing protein
MKQKFKSNFGQAGFTLVELIVVLAMMTLIMAVLVVDFSRQRGQRNLVLAKNETVTNIRKVQSYMLSSRNIAVGVPAKFYMVTFNTSTPHSYKIQAVDSDYEFHDNIEIIYLPSSVSISDLRLVTPPPGQESKGGGTSGGGEFEGNGKDDQGDQGKEFDLGGGAEAQVEDGGDSDGGGEAPAPPGTTAYPCMQVIFSAPFGKMYTHGAETCDESIADVLKDPVLLSQVSEKTARIYFSESTGGSPQTYIELVPITGQLTVH